MANVALKSTPGKHTAMNEGGVGGKKVSVASGYTGSSIAARRSDTLSLTAPATAFLHTYLDAFDDSNAYISLECGAVPLFESCPLGWIAVSAVGWITQPWVAAYRAGHALNAAHHGRHSAPA